MIESAEKDVQKKLDYVYHKEKSGKSQFPYSVAPGKSSHSAWQCRNSGFIIYGIGMHTHSSLIETGYKKKDCDEDSKPSLKAAASRCRCKTGASRVGWKSLPSCAVKRYPGQIRFPKSRSFCRKHRIRVSGRQQRQFPALSERIFPGRVDLQRAYVVTGGETKSRTSASSLYRGGAFLSSFRR